MHKTPKILGLTVATVLTAYILAVTLSIQAFAQGNPHVMAFSTIRTDEVKNIRFMLRSILRAFSFD